MCSCYSGSDRKKPGVLAVCLITGVRAYLGFSNSTVMFSCIHPKPGRLSHQIKEVSVLENAAICRITSVSSWLFLARYFFLFFFFLFCDYISLSFTLLHQFLTLSSFSLHFSFPPLCVTGWELTDSSKPSQRPRPLALSCVQLASPPRLCLL